MGILNIRLGIITQKPTRLSPLLENFQIFVNSFQQVRFILFSQKVLFITRFFLVGPTFYISSDDAFL